MRLQRVGAFASLVAVVQWVVYAGTVAFVLPGLGLPGTSVFDDPVKGMAAAVAAPLFFPLLYLNLAGFGITTLLIVLALEERAASRAPELTRIAGLAAGIGTALFLAGGFVVIAGLVPIARAGDLSAFRSVNTLAVGLIFAGTHAAGWSFMLGGLGSVKARSLPRLLAWLLVAAGLAQMLELLGRPLQIAATLLSISATAWAAVVFLRTRRARAAV